MKAWLLEEIKSLNENKKPLVLKEIAEPEIENENEIIIKVHSCGICHTEIDEIEGRAMPAFFPIILGHQIAGTVYKTGKKVKKFKPGDRAGAGWIYSSCQLCFFCKNGLENLCKNFKGTGKDANGGYAEFFKINEDYAFKLPESFSFEEIAPLFCAGAIGYRSLKLTGLKDGENIGLVGFGASGHLVLKMIKFLFPSSKIFVFSRTMAERELSLKLGAFWAGDIEENPPERLNAAIDTTPVWKPPISVLKYLFPSGKLVINAIRKEDIDKDFLLKINWERDLWLEKEIKSVANVTRNDIKDFLEIAEKANIKPEIEIYSFDKANEALIDIKEKKIRGAKVLKI